MTQKNHFEVSFNNISLPSHGCVAILFTEENKHSDYISHFIPEIQQNNNANLTNNIIQLGKIPKDSSLSMIILVYLGSESELTELKCNTVAGHIHKYLNDNKINDISIISDEIHLENINTAKIISSIYYGLHIKSYKFDYKTKEQNNYPQKITFRLENHSEAEELCEKENNLIKSVTFTRNLVSEPANLLTIKEYARRCSSLSDYGLKVEVLGQKELSKLCMNALLGVNQGSNQEAKLVVLKWVGDEKKENTPLAFVGKGVVFDTGGISLKPSLNMHDMKYDMAGSAAVVGLMMNLALRKAKVNAVGVIGIVENMVSGEAQRPGDVITSMSGKTIEVLNTDAEGRLVLADALWYTQSTFTPDVMIDLATLTGAIIVTLSDVYAGLFSNDDKLAEQLYNAGIKTDEKLWRLPISKDYDKMIESEIADIQNISNAKGAGSITAAQFLHRFTNSCTWAHLDIAGVAWYKKAKGMFNPGATGFGVRLLDQFIKDNYENQNDNDTSNK